MQSPAPAQLLSGTRDRAGIQGLLLQRVAQAVSSSGQMHTLEDSHPVASSGENDSSTDSQQWEESHSVTSQEVEGGAWVPTGEGTWFKAERENGE